MEKEYEFKKLRLTKKNLETFLNEYEATLFQPITEGTPEERQAGFMKEWKEENEKMKKAGIKKNTRRNRKGVIKAKWGFKQSYKSLRTRARMSLISHIKNTFLTD